MNKPSSHLHPSSPQDTLTHSTILWNCTECSFQDLESNPEQTQLWATDTPAEQKSRNRKQIAENLSLKDDVREAKMRSLILTTMPLLPQDKQGILIGILMQVHKTASEDEYKWAIIPESQEAWHPVNNRTIPWLILKIEEGKKWYDAQKNQLHPSVSEFQFATILKKAMREGLCGGDNIKETNSSIRSFFWSINDHPSYAAKIKQFYEDNMLCCK